MENYYAIMDYRNGERGYTFYTREKGEKDFLEISSRILEKFFDDF